VLNRFITDTDEEVEACVSSAPRGRRSRALRCVGEGGEGGVAVAESLLGLLKTGKPAFKAVV